MTIAAVFDNAKNHRGSEKGLGCMGVRHLDNPPLREAGMLKIMELVIPKGENGVLPRARGGSARIVPCTRAPE